MQTHQCPVDRCDYGKDGGKGYAAVRSHVNASGDHPPWSDVEDQVEQQADDQDDQDGQDDVARQWGAGDQDDDQDDDQDQPEGDDGADDDDQDGAAGGMPIPISTTTLMGALAAVSALLLLRSSSDDQDQPEGDDGVEADDVDDQDAATTEPDDDGVDLLGGGD